MAARVEVYGEEKAAKRPVTLMDIATAAAKVLKKRGYIKNLDESEEINACSIPRDRTGGREAGRMASDVQERDTQPPNRNRAVRRRCNCCWAVPFATRSPDAPTSIRQCA